MTVADVITLATAVAAAIAAGAAWKSVRQMQKAQLDGALAERQRLLGELFELILELSDERGPELRGATRRMSAVVATLGPPDFPASSQCAGHLPPYEQAELEKASHEVIDALRMVDAERQRLGMYPWKRLAAKSEQASRRP